MPLFESGTLPYETSVQFSPKAPLFPFLLLSLP